MEWRHSTAARAQIARVYCSICVDVEYYIRRLVAAERYAAPFARCCERVVLVFATQPLRSLVLAYQSYAYSTLYALYNVDSTQTIVYDAGVITNHEKYNDVINKSNSQKSFLVFRNSTDTHSDSYRRVPYGMNEWMNSTARTYDIAVRLHNYTHWINIDLPPHCLLRLSLEFVTEQIDSCYGRPHEREPLPLVA